MNPEFRLDYFWSWGDDKEISLMDPATCWYTSIALFSLLSDNFSQS